MQRKVLVLLQAIFILCLILFGFLSLRGLPSTSTFNLGHANTSIKEWLSSLKSNSSLFDDQLSSPEPSPMPRPAGSSTASSAAPSSTTESTNKISPEIRPYLVAIMNPSDEHFSRLECPQPSFSRYDYLRSNMTQETSGHRRFFFALDLHQNANLLPRLMGSIMEAIRFLGPQNCALSVVEGRSDDSTYEILQAMTQDLDAHGVLFFLQKNDINPTAEGGDRIQSLAELRNQALQPLVDQKEKFSVNSTVIFLNDVAICMEDILELIHQQLFQEADMVCAMDWTYVGPDPTFYDVWIARDMNGESFFNIPEDGNWNSAWNLFWNNPESKLKLMSGKPFQVFSCWNGATAFTAAPIINRQITFRSHHEDECYQGEPQIFCKEMWSHGHGKIAVIPSVNLEYSDEAAKRIKALKGYVSRFVGDGSEDSSSRIEWHVAPPNQVKCIPGDYARQFWVAWNEALEVNGVSQSGASRLIRRSTQKQYWVPWDESLLVHAGGS